MRFSLAVLAIGTLTTWLLAGPFSRMLAETLPFHQLEVEGTGEIVRTVFLAPATWLALLVIAIGFALWFGRSNLAALARALKPALAGGFGLEALPGRIAAWTERAAASLQATQTGQLSWNIVGIPVAVIVVLFVLLGNR